MSEDAPISILRAQSLDAPSRARLEAHAAEVEQRRAAEARPPLTAEEQALEALLEMADGLEYAAAKLVEDLGLCSEALEASRAELRLARERRVPGELRAAITNLERLSAELFPPYQPEPPFGGAPAAALPRDE